jgi:hypothetical protein
MNIPHKHAAVIKAWADGATIEVRHRQWPDDEWYIATTPGWDLALEYRVKPKPHKWQKEMDAQRAGKIVQYRARPSFPWEDPDTCNFKWAFDSPGEYRIKPEPITFPMLAELGPAFKHGVQVQHTGEREANLNLTFEDGKLVAAEVIKK